MKFSNILFPVDFSERCRGAAPFVSAIARRDDAVVTLVHFVDLNYLGTPEAPCLPDVSFAGQIEEAEDSIACFAKELLPGIQTKVLAEAGDPGSCIVEMAREMKADLIMLPTRGRGLFRAALLGSVTAKVLHDSDCPVWTSAHIDTPGYAADTDWKNVVCAIETTPDALPLIRHAAGIAAAYGSKIYLAHAVPPSPDTVPEKYFDHNFDAYVKDFARQTIAEMQKEAGTNFAVCLGAGKVSTVIAQVAQHHEADVVVIGRGVLPHFAGRLRTHEYSIIRDAPCPVLSF